MCWLSGQLWRYSVTGWNTDIKGTLHVKPLTLSYFSFSQARSKGSPRWRCFVMNKNQWIHYPVARGNSSSPGRPHLHTTTYTRQGRALMNSISWSKNVKQATFNMLLSENERSVPDSGDRDSQYHTFLTVQTVERIPYTRHIIDMTVGLHFKISFISTYISD